MKDKLRSALFEDPSHDTFIGHVSYIYLQLRLIGQGIDFILEFEDYSFRLVGKDDAFRFYTKNGIKLYTLHCGIYKKRNICYAQLPF